MSRFHSYLNSTTHILSSYDGGSPFSLYIKKFFSKNKKYGSRDRRLISSFCYQYFRLGNACSELSLEEKVLTGIFLCSDSQNQMLETHKPEWNALAESTLDTKFGLLSIDADRFYKELFPWSNLVSASIELSLFVHSFLTQPDVFIRIRPNFEESTRKKLKEQETPFQEINDHSLSFAPATKVQNILSVDSEIIIQDLSSQKIGGLLTEYLTQKTVAVWDCCAASGGKSIMSYDINPSVDLTVSDIRESMLINLKKRFSRSGIHRYTSKHVDLRELQNDIPNAPFDVIIADVPCSGSGTWSRTPEQLCYFDESKIEFYAQLQRNIIKNSIPHLKKGGHLVYITCSVFKQENEDSVQHILENYGFTEELRQVIPGYEDKADSMFISILKK